MRFIEMVLYANRGAGGRSDAEEIFATLGRRHPRFLDETWDLTTMRFAVCELCGILGRMITIYDIQSGKRWLSVHVPGRRPPVFIYVRSEQQP